LGIFPTLVAHNQAGDDNRQQTIYMMRYIFLCILMMSLLTESEAQHRRRARDYGLRFGVLPTGTLNAITDVTGLKVGHTTIVHGDSIRTGVTAILPYDGNIFQAKVPAAIFVGNGFGKLTGSTQVAELGNMETPIILTNTLNVAEGIQGLLEYTLQQPRNESVQSVNAVVGETNDGFLNDIRGRHVKKADVLSAIRQAKPGQVEEGAVGAGTGTVCFGFKGGIGTASRHLPQSLGGYCIGVLVQSNFGGVLQIDGVPVGRALGKFDFSDKLMNSADGSCMMVVATDAPLDSRSLERLAKRAFLGLAKTGGIASNGSGDYVIAFSTAASVRVPHQLTSKLQPTAVLSNEQLSPLFMAAIEATEEAIINSLFAGKTTTGRQGHRAESLPLEKVIPLLKKYNAIKNE
jgi:D-aminopeptidase